MPTDYEAYQRIKAEKRQALHDLLDGPDRKAIVDKLFDLLHDARGFVMALRSDFPLGLMPDDAAIDEFVSVLEDQVGPAYPQR